jgi:hypothetical protein
MYYNYINLENVIIILVTASEYPINLFANANSPWIGLELVSLLCKLQGPNCVGREIMSRKGKQPWGNVVWCQRFHLEDWMRSITSTVWDEYRISRTFKAGAAINKPSRTIGRITIACSGTMSMLHIILYGYGIWPSLWPSGQSPGYRSRGPGFDSLPYILRSSGSGTGYTQPHEDNWGATWKESSGFGLQNRN